MTQNLYVGADLFRILEAQAPEDVPFVVAEIFQSILETDFPERAAGIAMEIKHRRPDLIGLQEVSWISVVAPGEPPDVMVMDYLQELLAAMESLGLHYEVAAMISNADVELPIATPTGLGLARLVDHDVILARRNVRTSNVTAQHYTTKLQIPIGDPPVAMVEFVRGYVAVDAFLRGSTYRFVNTHLEVQGGSLDPLVPFVQAAQAQELIAELASEARPVILVGDFNSSPQDPVMLPLIPPYVQFVAAGYTDAWTVRDGIPEPGFSCCQDETLTNPVSFLSERIDLIFLRNDAATYPFSVIGPVQASVVGADPASRTPSGLWLSDHAGVDARLRIPVPRGQRNTRARLR
jgi:endonuclease/exonuclease/phosphatase family metal-dependent hydrolase